MITFAAVGALGAVLNLLIMAGLIGMDAHYLVASIVATELTILSNFLLHERLVFHDRLGGRPFMHRLVASFGFNNIETLVRIPVLILLVSQLHIHSVVAQAATLAVAFILRFTFTSSVIYRHRPEISPPWTAALTGERTT
ncbi:GtrA family protein [Cellulosimicrobium funkei]|nr:GtrA family protein [Cellulosimicrobium funkei]